MQEQDANAFLKIFSEIAETSIIIDPKSFDLKRKAAAYFRGLRDEPCSLEEVAVALRACVKSNRYFPALADVIEKLNVMRCGGLTFDERMAQAWEMMLYAIRRFGDDSVRFPVPAFHYVVLHDPQGGNWCRYGLSINDDNRPFRYKDFCLYFAIGEKKATFGNEPFMIHVPSYLVGEHEMNNKRNGFLDACPPRVIEIANSEKKLFMLPR